MGCQLSLQQGLYLAANELGFDEADLQEWRVKDHHIECLALVEGKWLQELCDGVYTKPNSYSGTSYERFLLLQRSNNEVPKPWKRVVLKIYNKPLQSFRIPKVPCDRNFPCSDTFADLMSYVSTENFKNYLLQSSKKYSSTPQNGDGEIEEISGEDILRRFAKHLFNLEIIKLGKVSRDESADLKVSNSNSVEKLPPKESFEPSTEKSFSGLLSIYGILESKSAYFVFEPLAPHSLQDVVWFSPSVISSTITKPLFLLYQILKMFETFHAFGYYCTVNSLQNIMLGNCLWLHLSASSANVGDLTPETKKPTKSAEQGSPVKPESDSKEIGACEVSSPFQNCGLPELIDMWVKKEISNFDYLMALNKLAGRRLGDPNYHPVLPWVTDFTSPSGKYRDLTKSKFRINKGDFQLDITFKNVADSDEDVTENPPHHVSGVLSEITYHVYLSRRTPKSVLQKHVRAKWEPNEYPANMQRLQEWTPDECIPEFYSDPTIFKSIHPDLQDLGIPPWAKSTEDFVRLHRKALESEYVCAHLHDWIDLTFGYKLVGLPAEKAKNVYLHLVDQHQTISSHGVVQLFEQPHPKQHRHHDMVLYPSMVNLEDGLEHEMRDVSNEGQLGFVEEGQAEYTCDEVSPSSWDELDYDMKVETGEDELNASTSFKKLLPRPTFPAFLRFKEPVETTTDILKSIDSLPISLPIGYGPLEEFDQVELLTKFKMQTKQNGHPVAKNTSANDQVANSQRLEFPDTARHNEIQNLCTMLMEMFHPAKMRLLPCDLTQKERFHMAKKVFSAGKFAIPGILRDGVKTLFEEGCGLHKRHGFPPLTPELLLQQHVNIIPFPSYFKKLYEFLVEFNLGNPETSSLTKGNKNCEKFALTNNLSDLSYISRQVEIAVRHLPDLLTDLNGEGLDLLISYLRPLFANENTQLQAFLHLFEPLAARLGPQRTKKTFLKQLLKHYDVRASNASVLLFHQSFLSKLIVRFGMDQFLDHFLSFIVDALNSSNKDPQVNVDTCSQEEVQGAVLEDDKDPVQSDAGEAQNELSEKSSGENGESSGQNIEHVNESGDVRDKSKNQAYSEPGTAASRPSEKSSGIAEAGDQTYESRKDTTANFDENTCIENSAREKCDRLDPEPGVDSTDCAYDINFYPKSGNIQEDFLSDDEEEYGYENEVDEDDDEVGTIEKNDAIFNRSFPTVAPRDSDDDWERIADSDFSLERSVSFHSEHLEDDKEDVEIIDNAMEREIPEAAAESICCFTPRLGPLLTSNHIIKPLLGLLVKCYVGVVGLGDKGMLIGDTNAKWILRCIRSCAEVYGEAVVVHQYLPFVMSKINISSEHVSVKGEANLAGALVLVREYISCISQDSLLQQFEMLCYQALDQVLCLISSATITFASEAPARTFLALLILDILQVVCEIFERPSAQDLLSPLIATLFSCFEFGSTPTSPNKDSSPGQPCADEIRETFNASLAYNLYITLCKCLGDTYMTATLDKNNEMIWQLCCSVDKALSNHTPKAMTPTDTEPKPKPFDSESSYLAEPETRKAAKSASLERSDAFQQEKRAKTTFVSSRQHLTGNWLKYWKSHLGKRKKIDGDSFSQLKLQTFAGHSDVVKDIHIQDSEHLFLSASRDKTVKLWLLNNHGDGTGQSACSWTTYDHRKPVFAVDVIDVMRQAVSCDGSVHFWDIPTGSSVLKLKFQKSKEAVAMATLPCPSPCLVTGMQNSTVRFIDSREGNFGHTWKVTSNGLAGNIRSLCVTQDGTSMAVGFSSGSLSLVDLRGGILTRQWKAHEAEIIQVKPYTNSSYVTSSSTQKMELWGNDAVSLCSLPTVTGSGETIQSIQIHDKVIVSLAGNNRIAWHTFTDKEPTYTHLRLGSDVFKGNMTCFGVLPLNRGYLLGSDNGNITLMG